MKLVLAIFCFFELLAPSSRAESPAPVRVAAAADLKYCLETVAQRFNREHPGTPVEISFGSSGNFFTQIQNGAPFDVFLSADIQYPRKLAEAGMGASPVFVYGTGRLVVWIPNPVKIDESHPGLNLLLEPAVRKVSIANPEHAPYGRAAVAALKSANLYETIAPKLVYGENIAQAAQFAQSGGADAGILALSLALSPALQDSGKYWEIPRDSYPKIEQAGIVLKSAQHAAAAEQFRDCLTRGWGRQKLKENGFLLTEPE